MGEAMPEEFDAYYRWLGIPPQEQPPDHYRLLGIELFEADADVTEAAADRQMAHLRTYQTGKHGPLSQKLLNEVAAAKITLLNPRKKARYDEQLKLQLHEETTPQPASAVQPTAPSDEPARCEVPLPRVEPSLRRLTLRPRKRSWQVPAALGVGALAALGLLLVMLLGKDGRQTAREDSDALARNESSLPADKPVAPPDPAPTAPTVAKSGETPPVEPDPVQSAEVKLQETPDEESAPPRAVEPADNIAAATKPATPAPLPEEPKRLPVPADADQERITRQLEEIYNVTRAKKPAEKAALAKTLVDAADQSGDGPAARFVMFRLAAGLAAEGGQPELIERAVDELAKYYVLDPWEMKAELFARAADSPLPAEARSAVARAFLPVIEEAVDVEQYRIAERLCRSAVAAARRARDLQLVKTLAAYGKEVRRLSDAHAKIESALALLESDPNDPQANFIAGRFVCVEKGDWKKGLPMLTMGSDAAFKTLAEKELQAPTSLDEKLALADDWWELAQKEKGRASKPLQLRAAAWYVSIFSEISGVTRLKVEKRLNGVPRPIPHLHYGYRKVLLIFSRKGLDVAKQACEKYGLAYDVAGNYDMNREDYTAYHTIISGSNKMDYWRSEETKKPEAFRHVEAFVNRGGHLIVLGSWNGRNNHHLGRFGIKTSYYHSGSFEPVPETTALLFQGNEAIIPEDRKMLSVGNFSISIPHTVLLKRGPGSYAGRPALAMLNHQKGRVTFTQVEPNYKAGDFKNAYWLITVLLSWVSRGCPT